MTTTGSLEGTNRRRKLVTSLVSFEKVTQLILVAVEGSGYKQARLRDAAVHHYIGRLADHECSQKDRRTRGKLRMIKILCEAVKLREINECADVDQLVEQLIRKSRRPLAPE